MSAIRVLTWNIHGCVGLDRRYDPERIAAGIRRISPDIAALQEVDTRRQPDKLPSNDRASVFDFLREQVGDHGYDAWALSGVDGHYGQMLASRFPLTAPEVHDISVPGYEPRKVIVGQIETVSRPLRVITTHLGLRLRERRAQLLILRKIIAAEPAVATVLAGDLNEWPIFGPFRPRLYDLFTAWTSHASFPSNLPLIALDRILCRRGLRLQSSWADREARRASDHLPVVADLTLPEW